MRENSYRKNAKIFLMFLISFCILLSSVQISEQCSIPDTVAADVNDSTLSNLPKWNGSAYVTINDNNPAFSKKQKHHTKPFVKYGRLDSLGRAGKALGRLGKKTIHIGERESITAIRPSGWSTKKYPKLINDRYVFNRCHLLMQAAAAGIKEKDCNSSKNLITGTRYLNVDGMLIFERQLLDYLSNTKNHVLYMVTPIYKGDELVARGVQIEGYSIEDHGKGLKFNVFCYNVQPGIKINYDTGQTQRKESFEKEIHLALEHGASTVSNISTTRSSTKSDNDEISYYTRTKNTRKYVLNTNTKKIHLPGCPSAKDITKENKRTGYFSKKAFLKQGYTECKRCHP